MNVLYNESDPYCAQWLRNLIEAGHIAPGVVDERSIEDITPNELREYTQVHCFAGIGVWSYALRLAGWPDDRPVWTGSCPCQPFSAAGKGNGFADERHLWPAWFHLVRECKPGVVFGEQVASRDGLGWLDLVHADLEGAGYARGAVDLCAAGVGAPHIRQRLWFVADAIAERYAERNEPASNASGWAGSRAATVRRGELGGMANVDGVRFTRQRGRGETRTSECRGLGNSSHAGLSERIRDGGIPCSTLGDDARQTAERASAYAGFWSDAEWIACRDGKRRPVEPGTFPLAHGVANRVGRLRAYGNAINAEAAATFIRAYLDGQSERMTEAA